MGRAIFSKKRMDLRSHKNTSIYSEGALSHGKKIVIKRPLSVLFFVARGAAGAAAHTVMDKPHTEKRVRFTSMLIVRYR